MTTSDPAVFELDAASFAIGGRTLLAPLTARFEPGRTIGLIGHNGSGKSTLLKLLAGQQPPSSGVVRFAGRPSAEWGPRAFARRVAYLPQQPATAAGLKARELIALGRYPWHGALGRFGEADRAAVEQAMELTDVTIFADRMVDELSGGERQRVWLAMLVAQRTEWMLLDEPTSALDVAHQMEVLTLVRRLSQNQTLGVVLVLHDVNAAARVCDEIVALHSGRLIARGAAAEVLTERNLRAIYGIDMEVIRRPGAAMVCAVR